MLIANSCSFTAFAAESTATLSVETGYNKILTVSAAADGATGYEYRWYHSENENGEYTPVYKQTSEKYVIANDDIGTYLRAEATPVYESGEKGTPITSEAYHVDKIGILSRTNYTTDRAENKENPSDNLVKVAGENVLILDEYSDKNSSFYVMSAGYKGRRVFDTAKTAKFNIASETNVGYFLNNDFLSVGNPDAGTNHTISADMQKYIPEHKWWVEAGASKSDCPSDYSFPAKFGLLSRSEYSKYWGKFGWDPNGDTKTAGWWLRTSRGNGVNNSTDEVYNAFVAMGSNEGYPNAGSNGWANTWNKSVSSNLYYLRPTFYLSEDIFRNEKAEVKTMGAEVKKIITERYTAQELSGIYTPDELKKIGFDISDASIEADTASIGAMTTLTAKYEDDNAVSYKYQWTFSESADGEFKDIYKQTGKTYFISNEDKGRYISVNITPVYADGSFGAAASSANIIYVQNLGKVGRSNYSAEEREANLNNPSENFFYAAGERLLLLDETNDENSAFYVITSAVKGRQAFDPDNTSKFDISDENNLAYLLNNDFLNKDKGLIDGGNSITLSSLIIPYIDKNHVWWTEPSGKGDLTADYSYTGPISLLSRSEYSKYWGKFGWDPESAIKSGWWLRTARDTNATNAYVVLGTSNSYSNKAANSWGNTWDKNANTTGYYVRPTFWLNSKFFLENKVEVSTMGADIKKMLVERYTKDDLKGLYTDAELGKIGFPTIISIQDEPYNIYTRSEAAVDVDYTAADTGDVVITYTNGKEKGEVSEFLYPDDIYKEKIVMENLPYGKNNVTVTMKSGDGTVISEVKKKIYIVPDQPKEKLIKNGIVIHPTQISKDSGLLPLAAKLGFSRVRIDFSWASIESAKGEYDFSLFDSIMEAAENNNLEVLPILDYNNTLYSDDGLIKGGIDTEEERAAFVNYAKEVANRYPQIKSFEIWNEPNSSGFWQTESNVGDYSALVNGVSDALYSINPGYRIYAGAIDVSKSPVSFVTGMMEAGLYGKFDALSYHPYFHPSDVNAEKAYYNTKSFFEDVRIKTFKDILLDNGGFKDLAATEIGFDAATAENGGESVKAQETVKAIVVSNAYNLDTNYVFNLKNESEAFGVLTSDMVPNELMYSISQLNSAIGDAKYLGKLDTDETTYAYVFIKNNKPVTICWSTNGDAISVGGNAKAYDLNGNEIGIANNCITLTKSPVYIYGTDDFLSRAAANEASLRKERIISRYPSVTEEMLNSENAAQMIMSGSMSEQDKSAALFMLYEANMVDALYSSISAESAVPTDAYKNFNKADGIYSKAAWRLAEKYSDENDMLSQSSIANKVAIISANNKIINELLKCSEILGASKVSITDIKVESGVLTFKVSGTDAADVWVAQYSQGKITALNKVDLSSPSCNVSTDSGKIFVWKSGTIIPLTDAQKF